MGPVVLWLSDMPLGWRGKDRVHCGCAAGRSSWTSPLLSGVEEGHGQAAPQGIALAKAAAQVGEHPDVGVDPGAVVGSHALGVVTRPPVQHHDLAEVANDEIFSLQVAVNDLTPMGKGTVLHTLTN